MAMRDYLAGEVAQDFGDGFLSRREALRRLLLLGLTMTSAGALLAACGDDEPSSRAAGTTKPTTAASTTTEATAGTLAGLVRFPGASGELQAAWASATSPKAGVLVVHENQGLTPHFYDLTTRLASAGYSALAVDL